MHFVVHVGRDREAGRPDQRHRVAAVHLLPPPYDDAGGVGVGGADAVAVVDLHEVAVAVLPARLHDLAGRRRHDRAAAACGDVDPVVRSDVVEDRMAAAHRERAGEESGGGPDRGRGAEARALGGDRLSHVLHAAGHQLAAPQQHVQRARDPADAVAQLAVAAHVDGIERGVPGTADAHRLDLDRNGRQVGDEAELLLTAEQDLQALAQLVGLALQRRELGPQPRVLLGEGGLGAGALPGSQPRAGAGREGERAESDAEGADDRAAGRAERADVAVLMGYEHEGSEPV